jgi:hypothetical protein
MEEGKMLLVGESGIS